MSSRTFRTASGERAGVVASLALALTACADPTASERVAPSRAPLAAQAPAHGQLPAAVEWNAVTRGLVAKNRTNTFVAFRVYALVSVAQQEALRAAEEARSPGSVPSRRAAIAGASAAVLGQLYPMDASTLEALLQQQLGSRDWLEQGSIDVAAGEAAGRAAGMAVVEHAKSDGYLDAPGPVSGPGGWTGVPGQAPGGASLVNARTWFLESPSQFRPGAHPLAGTPEFQAALDEVYRFSEERKALTPQGRMMDSIAKFWAMGGGTYTPPGYWNEVATNLALRYSMNEARATRLLALLNMTAVDAIIASNDAKYHYFLLRPSQADTRITLSITPLPNFPAYPSNHATISAAMAEIIAAAFPSEARALRAAADEAALSRVYGGIHYRFDGAAGLALGRQVAEWALAQDRP